MNNLQKWKLPAWIAVIVLLNVAGQTLFFRVDLTSRGVYSLSEASRQAVEQIREPLTIKAYFSETLPAQEAIIRQETQDILEEYNGLGNRHFNYEINTIANDLNNESEASSENRRAAQSYNIFAVTIPNQSSGELSIKSVFKGLAIIQGDTVNTLPSLNLSENLEYQITMSIRKTSKRPAVFVNMEEDIKIDLFFSSAIIDAQPQMRQVPDMFSQAVNEINPSFYNRLVFRRIDPVKPLANDPRPAEMGLQALTLRDSGADVYESLAITLGDRVEIFSVLNIINYAQSPDDIQTYLAGIIDKMANINPSIGYLSDHDTLALQAPNLGFGVNPGALPPRMQGLNNFVNQTRDYYNIAPVNLADGIPDDIGVLIIAGPGQPFNQAELYQLDQFVMAGNQLVLLIDKMQELTQDQMQQTGVTHIPLESGLEKLLAHHGVQISDALVLDDDCPSRPYTMQDGSIQEINFYHIPFVRKNSISDHRISRGLDQLLVSKISPLEIAENLPAGRRVETILESSSGSWLIKERIALNPLAIYPPSQEERQSHPLMVLVSGELTSLYAESGPPAAEESGESDDPTAGDPASLAAAFDAPQSESATLSAPAVTDRPTIKSTEKGRILVAVSSDLLTDTFMDPVNFRNNSALILNALDYLNGSGNLADMRNKGLGFTPLAKVSDSGQTLSKGFNIFGLPLLVVLTGLAVWRLWKKRQRKIKGFFAEEKNEIFK